MVVQFRYTDADGKRIRLPLGAYDRDGTTGLTLKAARKKANELSALYQSGIINLRESLEAEENARIAIRDAELARIAKEKADAEAEAKRLNERQTVRALFERWIKLEIVHHKDGGAQVRRIMEKDVLPYLGFMHVEDVKKSHIMPITDEILGRGKKRMAKVVFSLIRQLFNFAVERDIIEHNPTNNINKGKVFGKDNERDRVLTEDEIRILAKKLTEANLLPTTQMALLLTLGTCCRIGETLAAEWQHINFDKREWFIPSAISKNGKSHTIYLSDFSLGLFNKLREMTGTSKWCFPNRHNNDSVCSKTVTKQIADRQSEGKEILSGRTKRQDALMLPNGYWTPHDLRRTGASMMVRLGVIPDVADRCMNHTEQSKLKRIYIVYDYAKEMAQAWDLLGERLNILINLNDNNIVVMQQTA